MTPLYELIGGRLQLYRRPRSRFWQCATTIDGVRYRQSTKHESIAIAKELAEDWFLTLLGKSRAGARSDPASPQPAPTTLSARSKSVVFVAELFLKEYALITQGQRSPLHVDRITRALRSNVLPFFKDFDVSEVTAGKVQEYRMHRVANSRTGRPPARSTLHQEVVALRQVLKTAQRHGWLASIPDLSPPYKASGKVTHRAWFSPQEYRQLYMATRKRAEQPLKERWRWECEQLHDYVLFMANTGLRPDEAARLEHRDVRIVRDAATNQIILEIEVRGKRGVGYCKSTAGAVRPYRRLRQRNKPQSTDRVFPGNHRELFNTILDELSLKVDRDGNRRTAYSLRHTYICLRLMEGADIYQIAKNCRTSVEMIEKYYAAHIKNTLDAASINVRRPKRPTRAGASKKPKRGPEAGPSA